MRERSMAVARDLRLSAPSHQSPGRNRRRSPAGHVGSSERVVEEALDVALLLQPRRSAIAGCVVPGTFRRWPDRSGPRRRSSSTGRPNLSVQVKRLTAVFLGRR